MAESKHTITVGIDVVIQSVRMGTTRAPADTEPAVDQPSRAYPTLEVLAEAMAYTDSAVGAQLNSRQLIYYLNRAGSLLNALGAPGGGLCQETMQGIKVGDEEPPVLRCVVDARHAPPHRTVDGATWIQHPFQDRPGITCCDQMDNCCIHDIPQHGCACCEHAVKIGTRRWTE